MTVNFNNTGNQLIGISCDMTQAEWSVGCWQRGSGNLGSGDGIIWQTGVGNPASWSALMSGNDQVSLFDTGNTSPDTYNRRKYFANGTDKAGVRFGPGSHVNGAATIRGILPNKQYETGDAYRTLVVVQRRAGVSETWVCRPGQWPELIASNTNAFSGISAITGFAWGASRASVSNPYDGCVDGGFHTAGRALSPLEIAQVANGSSANDINKTGLARAVIGFKTVSSTATADTQVNWNPTAGTTLTLNGVVITFVASAPTGNQVLIGAENTDTMVNLAAFLNASSDPGLNVATYESYLGNIKLRITHKTAGTVGESYTLAASSANIRLPVSAHLEFVEWEFTSLSSTAPSVPFRGGDLLTRSYLTTWGAPGAAIPDATPKPDAVGVDLIASGWVVQHYGGTANIALAGGYAGSAFASLLMEVRDLADNSVVLAEAPLTGFTASSNAWSGVLNNVPKGMRWLALRMRKAGGTDYTQTEVRFGVGEVVEIAGQSLGALWRSIPSSVVGNGFVSAYMSNDYTDTTAVTSGLFAGDANWHRYLTTSEGTDCSVLLGNALSVQANCVVGIFNRCMGGTNIATIGGAAQWAKRVVDLTTSKAQSVGTTILIHGHADAGSPTYTASLNTYVSDVHTNYGASAKFGLLLMSNIQQSVDQTDPMWQTRKAQDDWVKSKMLVDSTVFSAGQLTDLSLPEDGVHPNATERRKMPDRVARAMLNKMGIGAAIADGPRPVSATRTGAVIRVTFQMDGAASLTTVGGAAPTGFDVSADNFTSLLTVSSVAITGTNTVDITLSADPGQEVSVMHLYGRPGKLAADTTGRQAQTQVFGTAQAVPLYDDAASLIGLTVGRPAQGTYTALSTAVSVMRTTPLLALMCH